MGNNKKFKKNYRNNRKNAGKRNYSDSNSISDRDCDTLHNDPSWYEPFPGSTELVARQSFGTTLGTELRPLGVQTFNPDGDGGFQAVPGIMVIEYVPLPGVSAEGDGSSVINITTRAYYTTVRYAQRGSGTYDDSDMMIGTLSVMQAYEYWALLRRIYGALNMYSLTNKYLAPTMVRALGCDFEDLQHNIKDFSAYINQFALSLGEFALPADFTVLDRRIRLNSNIYVDGPSTRAQMYLFKPNGYYTMDELSIPGRFNMAYHLFDDEMTFADIVNVGNKIINSIRVSGSLMNMMGDIKNAYGAENLKHVSVTPPEYMVPILNDPQMILEIQNCTLMGELDNVALYADASTNQIVSYMSVSDPFGLNTQEPRVVMHDWIANVRIDNPTSQDFMKLTRLMACAKYNEELEVYEITECGTEVPTNGVIWKYVHSSDGGVTLTQTTFNSLMIDSVATTIVAADAEKFDYHPYIYVFTANSGVDLEAVFGDLDNYIIVPEKTLHSVNQYAVLGEFKTKKMDTFYLK